MCSARTLPRRARGRVKRSPVSLWPSTAAAGQGTWQVDPARPICLRATPQHMSGSPAGRLLSSPRAAAVHLLLLTSSAGEAPSMHERVITAGWVALQTDGGLSAPLQAAHAASPPPVPSSPPPGSALRPAPGPCEPRADHRRQLGRLAVAAGPWRLQLLRMACCRWGRKRCHCRCRAAGRPTPCTPPCLYDECL